MIDESRNSADEFDDGMDNSANLASNIISKSKGSTPSRPHGEKGSRVPSQSKSNGHPESTESANPNTSGSSNDNRSSTGKDGLNRETVPNANMPNSNRRDIDSNDAHSNKPMGQNPKRNTDKGIVSPGVGGTGPGSSINPPQDSVSPVRNQNAPQTNETNNNKLGSERNKTPAESPSGPQNNAPDATAYSNSNDVSKSTGGNGANSVVTGAAEGTGTPTAGAAAKLSGELSTSSAVGGAAGSSVASGAAAGAAGGAAGGATAGATVGSAAGPAGTVAGAAAGAVISAVIKILFRIILLIVFFTAVFMSHPSFLYDNPKSTSNRTTLEDSYNSFYESIEEEYRKDIGSAKLGAYAKTYLWQQTLSQSTRRDPVYAHTTFEGTTAFSDEDIAKISAAYNDEDADEISWYSDVAFVHPDDVYLKAASSNINMVLSMIDLQKKNWFSQLWEWFANTVTGGWYSNFISSIETWWNGFWNDFITNKIFKVEVEVEYFEEYIPRHDPDNEEDEDEDEEELYCYYEITVTYTFDLVDKGVGFYADKMGMDEEKLERATEMAYYLGDLFGTLNDEYFGFYVSPGYWDGEYSAGSHTVDIQQALEKYADQCAGLTFDRSGRQVFPLQGYSSLQIRSHYGPRPDFPKDPFHTGIDFSVPQQTPVLSIAEGVVLCRIVSSVNYGNRIYVYHGSGVVTMYAHLYDGRNGPGGPFADFKPGDTVRAGDLIGYVGTSGLSTGNHLHFQVFDNYVVKNPVGFFRIFDYALPK